MNSARPSRLKLVSIVAAYAVWVVVVCAWMARAIPTIIRLGFLGLEGRFIPGDTFYDIFFGLAGLCGLWLVRQGRRLKGPTRYAKYTLAFPLLWQASVYAADRFEFAIVRAKLADFGLTGLFVVGLVWIIWYVERRWNERFHHGIHLDSTEKRKRDWNPLHPEAWYYGRHNAKLHQSLAILANYSLLFFLGFMLSSQLGGCQEIYELPAGGGKHQTIAQTVKIQKVIKKKFVINPYSSIIMATRPIDDVKLQLVEKTAHKYSIGQGEGDVSGYAGGTAMGKTRFIRLEYAGGDWDQDFGIGADLNMLIQFNVRTGQKTADQTESRTISQLDNFPAGKSPPLMYMTGQRSITLSKSEIKTLREYLFDKQGMLFIDNGGSSGFHSQAFAMMRLVAPEIEPVKVPLDDIIHRVPYQIPFLPYVSPHGGRDAWGWKLNGRWVCYYHPGDIGDAWSDGHSGVRTEVWEACYQLGVNVMAYANDEYAKWLMARMGK
ncbi:MAG: DUF4159 domain-containing protein [Planctomycetia bacterium]|nr:DUF4159 domain-containing protein [Planctomycetia bacterium]